MIRVDFISPDGSERSIDASAAMSLMQCAKSAGVPGIDADCGGSMVCGTCHVLVDAEWQNRLAAASPMELEVLSCVPDPDPRARLSCQIQIDSSLHGLKVSIPAAQR